jgi:HD-GYP domain-containing protein (c-di-GMP phosphodiesterase class II)/GGDEF domain-containing protein
MRLVPIESVEPGARLARDVWTGSSRAAPLLRAGTPLRDAYVARLTEGGIAAVYVDDELSIGINVPVPLTARTQIEAARALETAFRVFPAPTPVSRVQSRGKTVLELTKVVESIIEDLENHEDEVLAFADLATVDAYTMQHSIDVTVLGILLGRKLFREYGWIDYDGTRKFDRIEERVRRLGLGLLLHDIGKTTIPDKVLNKRGPLEPAEWDLIRAYPAAGADMLTDETVGPRAKSIVRYHHERFDGSGYPSGLVAEAIPQLARIAAVADVFDAITSARPYKTAAPAAVGVAAIEDGVETLFDPEVVAVFRMLVAPYPAGVEVALSDGRQGIVSHVPLARIDRPVVRVITDFDGTRLDDPYDLPLARHPALQVSGSTTPISSAPRKPAQSIEIPSDALPHAIPPHFGVSDEDTGPRRPNRPLRMMEGGQLDPLTGLGRRPQLDVDLKEAVKPTSPPTLLVVFDLDGTGLELSRSRVRTDMLLRLLATRLLEVVGDVSMCYRSREAELSALIYAPVSTAMRLAMRAALALGTHEGREPFAVKFGTAVLPREAASPRDAMILADKRRKFGHQSDG